MLLKKILLGAVAAMLISASPGAAASNGWYLSMEAGANWVDDWTSIITPRNGVPVEADAEFETGWVAFGSVGYAFARNWRAELELGYRVNDLDTTSPGGVTWDAGDLSEATAMVNAIYDIRVGDRLGVSLGVGAGADHAEVTNQLAAQELSDDDWNFAYQGIAGLNYAIGSRTTAFVNYRYLRVTNPDFEMFTRIGGNPDNLGNSIDGDDFAKHSVTAGLRYALNAPEAVIADTPTAQPPDAEPMGPSRQFIVFFGFNKYNLTSAALRVISEAVVAAKETGTATVIITGHTDTVGSPDFNNRLSSRRSNAVKSEMVRQGVSSGAITTTGKGETELLVQTNDNVKEPQNRRATIDIN